MINKGRQKQSVLSIAMLGAWGCFAAGQACAGDALVKLMQSQAARGTVVPRSAPARLPVGHLDLAPPAGSPARESSLHSNVESFPSANRLRAMNGQSDLPAAFSAVTNEPRPQSRVEQLARNFHREGLPVAKLFQSNDALVHIGLSPKGKPGLWLIKKLH